MPALRNKHYQANGFESPRDTEAPVMSPPVSGAKLPEPVADTKPISVLVENTKSPADQAAEGALHQRLREMERAESLQRKQQQPQHATEPQAEQQAIPPRVQEWLSRHPQYTDPNDQIAQVEISLATMKCARDGLTWSDDDFLPSIERHLGIGNGQARVTIAPGQENRPYIDAQTGERVKAPAPSPRPSAPPQRMSAPVSAPPTREVPSMRTGRAPTYRAPLTADELQIAQASGITPEQYQANKERMLRMKAAGEIQ